MTLIRQALVIAAACVALVGCAFYKPLDGAGGYADTRLSENAFRVSFVGNGHVNEQMAADLALLRGAELALVHGYGYFVVVSERASSVRDSITIPGSSTSRTTGTVYGNAFQAKTTTTNYPSQTLEFENARLTSIIRCYRERPAGDEMVYDARFLFDSLTAKYKIKRGAPQL